MMIQSSTARLIRQRKKQEALEITGRARAEAPAENAALNDSVLAMEIDLLKKPQVNADA